VNASLQSIVRGLSWPKYVTREKPVVSPEDYNMWIENNGMPEWVIHNQINNIHLQNRLGEFPLNVDLNSYMYSCCPNLKQSYSVSTQSSKIANYTIKNVECWK